MLIEIDNQFNPLNPFKTNHRKPKQKCLTTGTLVLTAWFDNTYINVVRVSVRGLTQKPHGIFKP